MPQSPDSILIDSDSEGEHADSIWIGGVLYTLFYKDWEVVLSPNGWPTDNIIMAAQKIAIQHYPNMQGLQPVSLQKVNAFGVHTEEFVQIINIRNCHWCVVSTVGCDKGVVNVFDSLYPSVSDSTMNVIARLMYISESSLEVRMMDVEQQLNSSDSGVLAIAYMFDLCSGSYPCAHKYDHSNIRTHLAKCLKNCQFSRFPCLGECGYSACKSALKVDLHCTCRLPKMHGDKMAQCDLCSVWYHQHCMDIPKIVFDEEDISWMCKNCESS